MKKTLNLVVDNSMDATANTLDCQEHVKTAKVYDKRGDERLARLRDHLRCKNDQAGLKLLQLYVTDEVAEDKEFYGPGVEYKLIKGLGYVTKITRLAGGCIKLVKSVAGDDRRAA